MKRSEIVIDQIHDEPEQTHRRHAAPKPTIAYGAAMSSFFIHQDEVYQVRFATPEAFLALVNAAIETTKRPTKCVEALEELDYCELVDRFYSLHELLRQHATVPLYQTREEAEKALKSLQAQGIQGLCPACYNGSSTNERSTSSPEKVT